MGGYGWGVGGGEWVGESVGGSVNAAASEWAVGKGICGLIKRVKPTPLRAYPTPLRAYPGALVLIQLVPGFPACCRDEVSANRRKLWDPSSEERWGHDKFEALERGEDVEDDEDTLAVSRPAGPLTPRPMYLSCTPLLVWRFGNCLFPIHVMSAQALGLLGGCGWGPGRKRRQRACNKGRAARLAFAGGPCQLLAVGSGA